MRTDVLAMRSVIRSPRKPVEVHLRRSSGSSAADVVSGLAPVAGKAPGMFEVYREAEVRMTSTRFCGGDWHWRLSDADGQILLDTGGYASERACLLAVDILRDSAAFARISRAV